MKKKILVTDIEWDTENDGETLSADELGLPETVTIEDPNKDMIADVEEDAYDESIGDYLGDEYGYCVYGFSAEIIEEEN